MTIDEIRRACIDIGTGLAKEDKSGAREAIAEIQTVADRTFANETEKVARLAKELAAFKSKFKVKE